MKLYTTKTIKAEVAKICSQDIKNGRRKRFDSQYLYVIHTLRIKAVIDRRFNEDDYFPLNLELLRSILSDKEADNILKNLLTVGIIETDGKAFDGKSRGYRIKTEYLKDKWYLSQITDEKFVSKLERIEALRQTDLSKEGEAYQICNYWLRELKINMRTVKRVMENNKDAKEMWETSAKLLDEGVFFATVDKTARRMHTNLTNIPTPLRKALTIDGNDLWNVDIANSQPTFLGLIMTKKKNVDKKELETYLEICRQGQFYEKIAEMGGLDLDLTDYKVRKDFKQKIFQGCLFDRNRKELSKWEKVFQTAFPTIFNEVRKMKITDYNSVAIALQKEEASFIFGCIPLANNMIGKNKVVLLTIHDSIVSDKENIDMVQQVMEMEFKRKYNFIPKLEPKKI